MNVGILFLILAFVCSVLFTGAYWLAARGKERFRALGEKVHRLFIVFVLAAVALLFYYFLAGVYSFKYVYDYSSSDLSFFYLISAFWAGQQGTYLLWQFLLALCGLYIIRRGGPLTNWAMFFYGLITLFFGAILLRLSPFARLPFTPPDGAGLNPLLQDPWMVIHPPVVFVGYAVAALPFALAAAAMVQNRYETWIKTAFPMVALCAVMLAAGNILGGFWAYKTLGWGGYWAWDPVENSSFIPWMISLALIHGMLIERVNGALRKTNLALALFAFILVIYGTFLTRSGVLADFSVHSFVDLGVNQLLVAFLLFFIVISAVLFLVRVGSIKGPTVPLVWTAQEFVLLTSVIILFVIGVLVLIGTSWPLITTLFGNPGTLDPEVYSKVTFPLAILVGLFLGFSPFMIWGGAAPSHLLKSVFPSFVLGIVAVIFSLAVGVSPVSYLVYIFTAVFAVTSNTIVFVRLIPRKVLQGAAQLSHFGFGLMLIGILSSSAYTESQRVIIEEGSTKEAFNLGITYKGMADELTKPNNELLLTLHDGQKTEQARPKLYWSQRMEGMMRKPYIQRNLFFDLYLAPEQIQNTDETPGLHLRKGESKKLGGFTIRFREFRSGDHETSGVMRFGAALDVTDSTGRTETIVPEVAFESGQLKHYDVDLMPGLDEHKVRLEKIQADLGEVILSVTGLTENAAPPLLVMEVSKKPAMNVLWAGTIILIAGGLMSVWRRWLIAVKPSS